MYHIFNEYYLDPKFMTLEHVTLKHIRIIN